MKKPTRSTPSFFRRPLSALLDRSGHLPLLGDFDELYEEAAREHGYLKARLWILGQALRSVPAYIFHSIDWSFQMFINHLKTAFRYILRHKGYSLINLTGLAIGMACSLLIMLWVQDELSYDRFHAQAGRIHRVEFDQVYSGKPFHVNVTPHPLAPALKAEVPEIEDVTRVIHIGSVLIRREDQALYEDNVIAVDPAFLRIFSFPLLEGEAASVLEDSSSIVLTETTARKFFADTGAVGQVINVNNRFDLTVTGVVKDIPANSTLRFSCLLPYDLLRRTGMNLEDWNSNSIFTYVLLGSKGLRTEVAAKVQETVARHKPDDTAEVSFSLRPLTRLRLHSHYGFGQAAGTARYVVIFSVIALVVLLIACINFMNLATARSANRAREVGIRKVVGAGRSQVVKQFYIESLLFTLISLALAVGLASLLLPFFNTLSGKRMVLETSNAGMLLLGLLGTALFTGFVSGSYPALFLSSFHPARVLKGRLGVGSRSVLFRKILVVSQFSLSVALIIGTGVVLGQLNFMRTMNPGYDKENILYVELRGQTRNSYDALKAEILKSPAVRGITTASNLPSAIYNNTDSIEWEGQDPSVSISFSFGSVDYEYVRTLGLELVEGRDFDIQYASDAETGALINEQARQVMGVESALGARLSWGEWNGTVVGVIKDFHFQSLRESVEPLILKIDRTYNSLLLVRVEPLAAASAIKDIERTWARVNPNFPFQYAFVDSDVQALYSSEERLGNILKAFAGLAVFIACLGLFGLASYMAEQRTREVGIRKVLGARVSQIVLLLCREFLVLVLLANAIPWPVMYLVMQSWLRNFAYRTGPSLFIFAGALGAALAVAVLSVGFQALRAARANPAVSLKYE